MAGPRDYQVEGLVIRDAVVGERDRVVVLFSRDEGKLSFIARGARRPGSSLGPCVQRLTRGRFQCVRRRSLDLITQAVTVESYARLKADLWPMSCALYLAELVDSSTVEGAANRRLYDLLVQAMDTIDQGGGNDMLLRFFELRLLEQLGFCPSLRRCVGCNAVLQPVANSLSARQGGVMCPACTPFCEDALPLSVDALKVLRFYLANDMDMSCRARLSAQLAAEVEEHLRRFLDSILQKELKSRAWLSRLRAEALLTGNREEPTIARRPELEQD